MSFLGDAFGRVIKRRRNELGLSQAEFAKRMQVEPPTASRWETGSSLPVNDRIDLILDVLKISAAEYLTQMAPVAESPTSKSLIESLNLLQRELDNLRANPLVVYAETLTPSQAQAVVEILEADLGEPQADKKRTPGQRK